MRSIYATEGEETEERESKRDSVYSVLGENDIDGVVWRFAMMEFHPQGGVEAGTVYGSAIALPQIARSMNYNPFFVILGCRSYLNLLVNVFLQLTLLVFIGQATQIMRDLSGEMHLCDFGDGLDSCPGAEHCTGPGGTKFTLYRNYGFEQWTIQKFAKQALLDVFPDQKETIEEKVDPGEYGVESYYCRLLCILVFTTKVLTEAHSVLATVGLLIAIPSTGREEELSWVKRSDEGEVSFRVAGMPTHWKVINFCFVVVPRALLCHYVLWEGTVLLMDTAVIRDMVFGAMSMAFVLDIDKIIFTSIASVPTKQIMENLEKYSTEESDAESCAEFPPKVSCLSLIWFAIPVKFSLLLLVTFFYAAKYYHMKCQNVNGTWVSKDMFYPLTASYGFIDFFLDSYFHTVPRTSQPFWTMQQINATDV